MTTAHGNSILSDNSECVVRNAQTLFNTDYGFCSPPRFSIGKPVAEYAGGGEISLNDKTELPPAEHHFFAISKILCGRQLICVIQTPFSAHCKTCAGGNSVMSSKLCSPSPAAEHSCPARISIALWGEDILVQAKTPSCFSHFVLCRPPSTYSVLISHSLLSRRI